MPSRPMLISQRRKLRVEWVIDLPVYVRILEWEGPEAWL